MSIVCSSAPKRHSALPFAAKTRHSSRARMARHTTSLPRQASVHLAFSSLQESLPFAQASGRDARAALKAIHSLGKCYPKFFQELIEFNEMHLNFISHVIYARRPAEDLGLTCPQLIAKVKTSKNSVLGFMEPMKVPEMDQHGNIRMVRTTSGHLFFDHICQVLEGSRHAHMHTHIGRVARLGEMWHATPVLSTCSNDGGRRAYRHTCHAYRHRVYAGIVISLIAQSGLRTTTRWSATSLSLIVPGSFSFLWQSF